MRVLKPPHLDGRAASKAATVSYKATSRVSGSRKVINEARRQVHPITMKGTALHELGLKGEEEGTDEEAENWLYTSLSDYDETKRERERERE